MPDRSLFDLDGTVAVVTGSSRGIGRAVALRLAAHGARTVVSSRNEADCEGVKAEIEASGGVAATCRCNVSDKDDLAKLVETPLRLWGRLDTLVCNAAVNPYFGPAAGVADDVYEKVMNANVRSNFWLCNMVAPTMAGHGGSIILISSILGLRGTPTLGLYALSKAADLQLVRNVAVEWGPKNVRANSILPGLIRTNFSKALWDDPKILQRRLRDAPLQRIGEADEIAGAAVFLASRASSFMTGQTMTIDGGVTAGQPLSAME